MSQSPLGTADHSLDDDPESSHRRSRAVRPIIGVIVATAVFWLARDLLLPLAMAAVLAIIFSPIASRLERFIGRVSSAAVVVVVTIAALGGIGYFLTVELASVAVEVASYSDNIAIKISSLEKSTPEWLHTVEEGVSNVQHQLRWKAPRSAVAQQPSSQLPNTHDLVKQALPIASDIGEGALVIVLLFFLLYGRSDLRNRLVRLAARGGFTVAGQAIETAGEAVGRYLLFFSLINLGYGMAVTVVMWVLDLPNPEFWGMMAFLLRFIPYVDSVGSAIMPTLVAFAVFPRWSRSIEVLGSFIILDQITAHLGRTLSDRTRYRCSPRRVAYFDDVLGVVVGNARSFDCDPAHRLPEGCGRLPTAAGFLAILLDAESP